MKTYTIAFVGNPNVGKSTWINALSNSHLQIGNWPGVTIEKKEANVIWNGDMYNFVDLPGCYSLDGVRNEECITADYLKYNHIDGIVNIVDGTNLRRNLVLTLILRNLQIPMLIIFNFVEDIKKQSIDIDIKKLEEKLQIPILMEDAFDKKGINYVKKSIIEMPKKVFYIPIFSKKLKIEYETLFNKIKNILPVNLIYTKNDIHQICCSFLKQEPIILQQLTIWGMCEDEMHQLYKPFLEYKNQYYEIIEDLMVFVNQKNSNRYKVTDKIDNILLHPVLGIIIFFIMMSYLICLIFKISAPWNSFISYMINSMLMKYVSFMIAGFPDFIQHFLLDGIIAGVGGVLTFIPLMTILYFVLTILEESGYMARIAYLLDRFMDLFHLSGKSFIAFMLGFGCNVPGIYATRTLENEKQKKLTAILVPFMSCGARIPIYVLFAGAFFPNQAALVVLSLYGLGLLFAFIIACLITKFNEFHDDEIFILELPPYRVPKIKLVLKKSMLEVKNYIHKAMSIVLLVMVIVWEFSYFPTKNIQTSYLAMSAKKIAPIFEPLGFGTRWECVASLPQGIVAKETIIASLDSLLLQKKDESCNQIFIEQDIKEIIKHFTSACLDTFDGWIHIYRNESYKTDNPQLINRVQSLWKDRYAKLRAFCFMVYVLLSIPCIMTLQAMYHEYGWRFVAISIGTMFVIAYIVCFFIFQVFRCLY